MIRTDRPLNLDQFTHELGVGVRIRGPLSDGSHEITWWDEEAADEERIRAALEAHVPDPDWTPPPPEPTRAQIKRARLRELASKARLTDSEETEYRQLLADLVAPE